MRTAATKTPTSKPRRGAPEATSMMHFRVDDSLRRDATATLEVIEQALPMRLDVPNETTARAMEAPEDPI